MELELYDFSFKGLFGKNKVPKPYTAEAKVVAIESLKKNGKSNRPLHPYQDLDFPLIHFSDNPADAWTLSDAVRGVQIFGSIGSGKSTGSGKLLAYSFLNNGFGGLVLCVKPDERANWEAYARETGRSDDIIIFDKDSGLELNLLTYELLRQSEGAGETINMVNLLLDAHTLSKRVSNTESSQSSSPFWMNALQRLLSRTIDLLKIAGEELTIKNMIQVVNSAPYGKDYLTYSLDLLEVEKSTSDDTLVEGWYNGAYCTRCLWQASDRIETDEDAELCQDLQTYFLRELATLAYETRTGLLETFRGITDPFERGIVAKHFTKGVNIFPEQTFNSEDGRGKIIIVDFPVKNYLGAGILAQGIVKLLWQQAVERRKIETGEPAIPVFLWADESQYFISEYDMMFQTTARSSRACTVYLTQNISNYYAAIGGKHPAERVNSLLGNLCTKVFHANNDYVTNQWAANSIGKVFRDMSGSSFGLPLGKGFIPSISSNTSEQLNYQVEPVEFTTLRGGGTVNDYLVDAYIIATGKKWSDDKGKLNNYRAITFHQDFGKK